MICGLRWVDCDDLRIRDDANVSHHAAVLMLADVAVIDKVANFGEGNRHEHRRHLACAVTPFHYRSITGCASAGKGHVVHHCSAIADGRAFGKHKEFGLVHVEVVRFTCRVDQFPNFGRCLIAGSEWEAHVDECRVEG